jgi:capsular polysaccharide transport system permease protein
MVTAEVEPISGIVTVKVKTFSPEDSLALAQAIRVRSEKLVNDLANRVRFDTFARAEAEIRRAAQRVLSARAAIRDFRAEHRVLDPTGSAKSSLDTIVKLRQDRIAAAIEVGALSQLSDLSPRVREVRARLTAIDEQIRAFENQLTQAEGVDPKKASEAIRAYEILAFDAKMAGDYLVLAEGALTEARVGLERHHIYLETYVPPSLPEQAAAPLPWSGTITAFLSMLAIWVLLVLGTAAIQSHAD